jgi:hypothetical protein
MVLSSASKRLAHEYVEDQLEEMLLYPRRDALLKDSLAIIVTRIRARTTSLNELTLQTNHREYESV